jgi:hypothetical protein
MSDPIVDTLMLLLIPWMILGIAEIEFFNRGEYNIRWYGLSCWLMAIFTRLMYLVWS